MNLCLVRHAIAVDRGSAYIDDRARPLTPEGRKRMAEGARGLKRLFRAEGIYSSPLLRARQTAEILAETFELKVRLLDALGNGDHPGTLAACASHGDESVFLVGHEPWMGELLSLLLTGDAGAMSVVFKKGAAALVATAGAPAAGNGILEWMAPPSMLRRQA